MSAVRLLLVEENTALRSALSQVLRESSEVDLLGVVSNMDGVIVQASQLNPDVLLMDIHMQKGSALTIARQVHPLLPAIKIVLLTEEDTFLYAEVAAESGVSACLPKAISPKQLVHTLQRVCREHRKEK